VSYRLHDRVYWTKHKVRIRSGETILTNGQTEVRARCGNCISMAPLLPTSDEEPPPMEFDAFTDDGAPLLVSWNLNAFGVPPVESSAVDGLPQLFPLVPFRAFGFPGGPGSDTPMQGPLEGASPSGGRIVPSDGDPVLPDNDTILNDSDTIPLGWDTIPTGGGTIPPTGESIPLGNGTVPPDTSVVPEPATFVLLGGGIAALFARLRRSKRISRGQAGALSCNRTPLAAARRWCASN